MVVWLMRAGLHRSAAGDGALLALTPLQVRVGRMDICDYMKFFTSINPKGSIPKFTSKDAQTQDPDSGINVGDDQAFLKVLGAWAGGASQLH